MLMRTPCSHFWRIGFTGEAALLNLTKRELGHANTVYAYNRNQSSITGLSYGRLSQRSEVEVGDRWTVNILFRQPTHETA
jgi:hypothetical protein